MYGPMDGELRQPLPPWAFLARTPTIDDIGLGVVGVGRTRVLVQYIWESGAKLGAVGGKMLGRRGSVR